MFVKMAEFVLTNNYFEFGHSIKFLESLLVRNLHHHMRAFL